jgi:hypothetical protein
LGACFFGRGFLTAGFAVGFGAGFFGVLTAGLTVGFGASFVVGLVAGIVGRFVGGLRNGFVVFVVFVVFAGFCATLLFCTGLVAFFLGAGFRRGFRACSANDSRMKRRSSASLRDGPSRRAL